MENVNELLSYIQQNLDAPKTQYNKQFDYNYRNAEDILNGVKQVAKNGHITLNDEPVEFANRLLMKSTATLSVGNEKIESHAYVEIPEKMAAMAKPQIWIACSSYARKAALTGLFACDDAKDLDAINDNNHLSEKKDYKKKRSFSKEAKQEQVSNQIPYTEKLNRQMKEQLHVYRSNFEKDQHDKILKDICSELGLQDIGEFTKRDDGQKKMFIEYVKNKIQAFKAEEAKKQTEVA